MKTTAFAPILFAGILLPLGQPNALAAGITCAPSDIVDLRDVAPGIVQDIRYYSSYNFIGRRIRGYHAPKCLLTQRAATALAAVQQELAAHGYGLKVYDCYRPQRAVDDFVAWARDLDDQAMKPEFYPRVDKRDLFRDGYIAARSGHSRGSTVDLTIVPMPTPEQPWFDMNAPRRSCEGFQTKRYADNSIDMATGYDCFSPLSGIGNPEVNLRARANRQLLKVLMEQNGFSNLPGEWWHYTLRDEPYPDTWFNFPIEWETSVAGIRLSG